MKFQTKRLLALASALLLLAGMVTAAIAKETVSNPVGLYGRLQQSDDGCEATGDTEEELEDGEPEGGEPEEGEPEEPTEVHDPDEPDEAAQPEDPERPEEPAPTPGIVVTNNEDSRVNLREKPGAGGKIIMSLPSGAKLTVIRYEGNWAYVEYEGTLGYVAAKYIGEIEEAEEPHTGETEEEAEALDPGEPEEIVEPEAPIEPEEPAPVMGVIVTENEDDRVNLREAPGPGGNIIMSLPRGAMLTVIRYEGNWVCVEYEGIQGYVAARYVEELPVEDEEAEDPMAGRSDLGLAVVKINMDVNENTQFGDKVTIGYTIDNFYGWDYSVQWQCQDEAGQWGDVPGATAKTHSFTLTEDNLSTQWRVRVDVVVPEELMPYVA